MPRKFKWSFGVGYSKKGKSLGLGYFRSTRGGRRKTPGLGTSKVNIGRTVASARAVSAFKPR